MHSYQHNVSGFYPQRGLAENTLAQLILKGLRSEQLRIVAADDIGSPTSWPPGSRHPLQEGLPVYGIAGAAIGITLGALLEVALMLGDASPMSIGPVMLIGWSALVGAALGCAVGAVIFWRRPRVQAEDNVLLVAETHSVQETAIARDAMKASANLCKDIDMRTGTRS